MHESAWILMGTLLAASATGRIPQQLPLLCFVKTLDDRRNEKVQVCVTDHTVDSVLCGVWGTGQL